MKQTPIPLRSLAAAMCLLLSLAASAIDFVVDGVAYNIISLEKKSVCVCEIQGSGDIVIPEIVEYNNYYFTVDSICSLFDSQASKSITFPKNLQTDGHTLYGNGTACFYVDSANPYMTAVDGVLYSKNMDRLIAFPPHKRVSEFTIPDMVRSIDDYSFGANRYIERLTFNDYIEELPEAFLYGNYYSGRLSYLKLSNKIKIIYGRCLDDLDALKEIILPKDLEEVQKDEYWDYFGLPTKLTDVTIYNSNIANYVYKLRPNLSVFSRFTSLKNLYVLDENPVALNPSVFSDGQLFTVNLIVPKGCIAKYQSLDGWKSFYNIVEFELKGDLNGDGVVDRADYALLVTRIADGAVYNSQYDLDGNGQVDVLDANLLLEAIE